MKLDSLDIDIMRILQTDGRKSFREISLMLDKPESTIRARYNQLVENKVLRVVAIPDPKQVNLDTMAIIALKMDLRYLDKAAKAIAEFEDVRYIAYTSGTYDLIIEAYMRSNDDLINFMTNSLSGIEGIKECDLSIELKLYKDAYDWLIRSGDKSI
ncbi:MAG TPA: Lrp/AsnC family transcriptional regulator [Clostridia bacterium]|nr:Lrp/AsnC family transcriptional regulator [Clostridia bacterium]